MSLPTGTKEQQRIALAGLRRGDWREMAETEPGVWRAVSLVDVDQAMLALFAVRVGA